MECVKVLTKRCGLEKFYLNNDGDVMAFVQWDPFNDTYTVSEFPFEHFRIRMPDIILGDDWEMVDANDKDREVSKLSPGTYSSYHY